MQIPLGFFLPCEEISDCWVWRIHSPERGRGRTGLEEKLQADISSLASGCG